VVEGQVSFSTLDIPLNITNRGIINSPKGEVILPAD